MEKSKEIINYIIFGVLTTAINFISYFFLTQSIGLDIVISNVVAWFISILFAYITNKIFVFHSKKLELKFILREMGAFFLARLFSGICCDIGLFTLLVKVFKFNDIIVKIIMQILVVIINFVLSKWIIFNKK